MSRMGDTIAARMDERTLLWVVMVGSSPTQCFPGSKRSQDASVRNVVSWLARDEQAEFLTRAMIGTGTIRAGM